MGSFWGPFRHAAADRGLSTEISTFRRLDEILEDLSPFEVSDVDRLLHAEPLDVSPAEFRADALSDADDGHLKDELESRDYFVCDPHALDSDIEDLRDFLRDRGYSVSISRFKGAM